MATNYLQIISEFFPTSLVKLSVQDPSKYENLVWESAVIPKDVLDTYANRSSRDVWSQHSHKIQDNGIITPIINTSLETIPTGTPVYSVSTDSITGRPVVGIADSDDLSKLPAMGITMHDVAANTVGLVCSHGIIHDVVNTSSYSAGDVLYVAQGGGLTNVRPTGSQWQKIATVSETHTEGDIFVNLHGIETLHTQRSMDFPIYGTSNQCYRSSTSKSFVTVLRFAYRGSVVLGFPLSIKVVAWMSSASGTGVVRLYDVTNSKQIATSTTFNNTSPAIINLSSIGNIPVDDAVFELQVQSSNTSYTLYASSVHIYFD